MDLVPAPWASVAEAGPQKYARFCTILSHSYLSGGTPGRKMGRSASHSPYRRRDAAGRDETPVSPRIRRFRALSELDPSAGEWLSRAKNRHGCAIAAPPKWIIAGATVQSWRDECPSRPLDARPPPPRGQALRGHDDRVCLRPGVECSRHSGPRAGIQGWGGRTQQRPADAENRSTSEGPLPDPSLRIGTTRRGRAVSSTYAAA